MNEVIEYSKDHRCKPNGAGDYTFICPKNGEKPGFVPYMQRQLFKKCPLCGDNIECLFANPKPFVEIGGEKIEFEQFQFSGYYPWFVRAEEFITIVNAYKKYIETLEKRQS